MITKTIWENTLEHAWWISLGILIAGTHDRLVKMTFRTSPVSMQRFSSSLHIHTVKSLTVVDQDYKFI